MAKPVRASTDSGRVACRRQASRSPASGMVTLTTSAGEFLIAQRIDVSPEGMGIVVTEQVAFDLGPFVEVHWDGHRRRATIAHITRKQDAVHIGLQWSPRSQATQHGFRWHTFTK